MAISRESISEELINEVKQDLGITWTDEATDSKIRRLIGSGMAYLNGKLGEPGDYVADGYPRTLLFEYVRYARDAALDVFENNYLSMILAMQNERRVQKYVESAEQAE